MAREKDKILIVDDTKHVVVLLKHYCTRAGYDTIESYDGKDALLKIYNERPDLVLLDAMMPEMSGFEVLKLLRDNIKTKFLPVIMVTALSELEDRVAALNAGVDDFLTKPVDSLLLITKIKSLLKSKHQREDIDNLKMDFTSILIHGLKAPLEKIKEQVKILKGTNLNDEQNKISYEIDESCEETLNVINEIIGYSDYGIRRISMNKKDENLHSLIDDAVKNFEFICQDKSIKIEKSYNSEIHEIQVDRNRILEVLMNLIEKAISNISSNGSIKISAQKENQSAKVIIWDSGKETTPEEISKMFIPFIAEIEGRPEEARLNMNLAISKMIIDAHEGDMYFESGPEGNKFIFKLPL